MAKSNTRLELTWIGKENRPKLEPRILVEDPEKSYHSAHLVTDNDIFDNRLIFGDNLLALKALEQEFTGRIKCIYIDPPYNTGSAFAHYDDGIEHSLWLSLMRERLAVLWQLLSADGSLWVSIDDREMPYLRVLLDELCGRVCFIAQNVWQKRYSRENREAIGDVHEYVVVYAKTPERFKTVRNRVSLDEKSKAVYRNRNKDPRGPWRGIPMTAQGFRPNQMYEIRAPGGAIHRPPEGRCWSMIEERFRELEAADRVYWGKDNNSQPNIIRYLSEVEGFVPWTWWPHNEVGHTDEAKKEQQQLFGKDNTFDTAKPERLMCRVLEIASNPGDIVLDSFAGSGTTGVVAHKMGRRWIMVELGEHCHTHIIPRMKKVVDGEDQGGISKAVNWKGGGGFRYYKLGPSLIIEDEWGNPVINPELNAAMLTEAMCKLEGFTFEPNADIFWQQGHSSETDFIYVTTQMMTKEMLTKLSEEVGPNRSLLICCGAFRCDTNQFENLTVKKIPKAVLKKCEWGHDDYSLEIRNLPKSPAAAVPTEDAGVPEPPKRPARKYGKSKDAGPTLFDMDLNNPTGGK